MIGTPAVPAQTTSPDPSPDRPTTAAPTGNNTTRLIALVRWLIFYGRGLAASLPQRAAAPGFDLFARRFRTTDLAQILARISRGLLLAAALKAKLVARAERGRDSPPLPLRLPTPRPPRTGPPSVRVPSRHTNIIDLPLDRPPTAREITAEVRRRPVGAVIVDICREFGIMPGDLTRAQWDELLHAVACHGGSLVTLTSGDALARFRAQYAMASAGRALTRAALAPAVTAAATGPP